jgi:hypothetical protein
VIVENRRRLFDLIDGQGLLPCHLFLPDDVAELPCIVVSPPTLRESNDAAVIMELGFDVFVLGRRIGDDDSQAELDDYADKVITILGGTRGRDSFAVTGATPQLVTVAGNDVPGYSLAVETSVVTC